mmetsp:Transcript_62769/g.203375  ORF Transcript_62769/g.203375 Transcript_62769/m.203375 type:complete len:395 (+) Transcript_62769:440-1624(+)
MGPLGEGGGDLLGDLRPPAVGAARGAAADEADCAAHCGADAEPGAASDGGADGYGQAEGEQGRHEAHQGSDGAAGRQSNGTAGGPEHRGAAGAGLGGEADVGVRGELRGLGLRPRQRRLPARFQLRRAPCHGCRHARGDRRACGRHGAAHPAPHRGHCCLLALDCRSGLAANGLYGFAHPVLQDGRPDLRELHKERDSLLRRLRRLVVGRLGPGPGCHPDGVEAALDGGAQAARPREGSRDDALAQGAGLVGHGRARLRGHGHDRSSGGEGRLVSGSQLRRERSANRRRGPLRLLRGEVLASVKPVHGLRRCLIAHIARTLELRVGPFASLHGLLVSVFPDARCRRHRRRSIGAPPAAPVPALPLAAVRRALRKGASFGGGNLYAVGAARGECA